MSRQADPPDDRESIQSLEIEFAIPIYLSIDHDRELNQLLDKIVNSPYNQPEDGVHWVSSHGSKPNWSQADSAFLEKPINPDAPESGEPTFDDSIYHIGTSTKQNR